MTSEDQKHMRRAVAIAWDTMESGKGRPFGAVVVRDGQVLAEGANTSFVAGDPTAHAEIVAIRKACLDLKSERIDGAVVYTSGEPCLMCMGTMYLTGVKRYVYALSVEDAVRIGGKSVLVYAELKRDRSERSIASEHMRMPETDGLFDGWLKRSGGGW